MHETPKCPVCEGETQRVDLPRHDVYTCVDCHEPVQVAQNGDLLPLGTLLDCSALGDDRIRAAISKSQPQTVKRFVDILGATVRNRRYEEDALLSGLASLLAQIENRLHFVLKKVAGPALIHEELSEVLPALHEVLGLVSTTPKSENKRRSKSRPYRDDEVKEVPDAKGSERVVSETEDEKTE